MNQLGQDKEPGRICADQDADKRYLIATGDSHLMLRTGRQIIDACQLAISAEVWLEELKGLLADVATWIEKNANGRISGCIAVPQGARVVLYFFPSSSRFDVDLAIELADLNAALTRQFNVGYVEFAQIPEKEKERFAKPELSLIVYGKA